MPFEDALAIRIDPSEAEDREEQEHGDEPADTKRAEHEHPWKQEDGERVEDDEDERDQVEADGELDPGAADRLGAAFVRIQLRGKRPLRAEHPRHAERHQREGDDEPEIDDDRQIALQQGPLEAVVLVSREAVTLRNKPVLNEKPGGV